MEPAMTMSAFQVQEIVPLLDVRDMASSMAFYIDGLGFEVTLSWTPEGEIRWLRLQQGGAGLMLQTAMPAGAHQAGPAPGAGVTFCLLCNDACALYQAALDRNLSPQEPFVGNGLWVTRLVDPDGYILDFASPAEAPEETRLSQWNQTGNA
jgi:hypothetical protein